MQRSNKVVAKLNSLVFILIMFFIPCTGLFDGSQYFVLAVAEMFSPIGIKNSDSLILIHIHV